MILGAFDEAIKNLLLMREIYRSNADTLSLIETDLALARHFGIAQNIEFADKHILECKALLVKFNGADDELYARFHNIYA